MIQKGAVIKGWGTVEDLWQDYKDVETPYGLELSKRPLTFITKEKKPRRYLRGLDIAELLAPYPNGVQLIVEAYWGNNREYIAVHRGEVIGIYHVDNYLRGSTAATIIRSMCAGNTGELLGRPFVGSLNDWKRAVKAVGAKGG